MSQTVNLDRAEIAQAELAKEGLNPGPPMGTHDEIMGGKGTMDLTTVPAPAYSTTEGEADLPEGAEVPTEEEMHSLRRVSGKIAWAAFTVAICEFGERFSYYGSSVLYTNFVVKPLPPGSNTGAGFEGQSGALGLGSNVGQGLSLTNQFFAYLVPLFGGWLADAHLGRYKTIHIAIGVGMLAHVILVAASAPSVIVNPNSALGAFIVGMLTLCFGTGLFKANVSPLLAEQNHDLRMHVKTLKPTKRHPEGERVIVDPAVTNTRLFLYFYFAINVGSLVGQISMVYVEKYYGFWLAFLLPTVIFIMCPIVLFFMKKHYNLSPPTGSVLGKAFSVFGLAMRGKWLTVFSPAKFKREFTWDTVRPSKVPVNERPAWMTYDDEWVDELRRGLQACKVFLFLPIFFLAYNQMTNNLTTQASTMQLNGVPNDLIQNLNPISIVILIPILDRFVYPGLRKLGFNFTPLKRMAAGFLFSSLSMIAAAVMQYYIYKMSPCGYYTTDEECTAPINVWAQSLPYVLVGISEIFTNTTSLEYAFSKAPENMKSIVMSVNLFMSAISAALGQAFTPIAGDPHWIWNYGSVAIISAVGGVAFWACFRNLDMEEDAWNNLKKSEFLGRNAPNAGHTGVDREGSLPDSAEKA